MHTITRRIVMASLALAAGALAAPGVAEAQTTARVGGRIVDAASGAGITGVAVQVVGTTLGTQSGVDGRYLITGVPAGTVTLQARRIGYVPKTVTGVMLEAGGAQEVNVSLESGAVQLTTQVVTAAAERGTVAAALDAQRESNSIIQTVTREQISRSPDSDAAQAVQRVSGVTVQDGRYVFVRGLGERYTTTSLNGARLPSPEPERRVVPLDVFPAGLLQTITTQKSFTPDQPGDFSGALVDIRTREFPLTRQASYSASVGYSAAVTGRDLPFAPTTGMEWLGFGGTERAVPAPLADGFGSPTQGEYNRIVDAFRDAWSPRRSTAAPNASFSATLGGNDPVFGRQLGYVGSLTYSRSSEVRADASRAQIEGTGGGREINRYAGPTGRTSVLWGGLLNLSTNLGANTRLSLNNTYNRTADNEARLERGQREDANNALVENSLLRFVERSVRSNQLAAEHQLGDTRRLTWSLTSSGVTRREPDRAEFIRVVEPSGASYWLDSPEAAVRTYGDLAESNYNAQADYAWQFGGDALPHVLKVGALGRYTDRREANEAFSVQALNLGLDDRRLAAEQIFDGRFTADDSRRFQVAPLAQGGSYDANEIIGAGYAMLEYGLTDRVRVIGGARVEHSATEVTAEPTIGRAVRAEPSYTDVLPSLAVNVQVADDQQLRFSAAQTLARPEYRELADVQYRDVVRGVNVLGNRQLRRTLIQNVDARWEWYPQAGEVLSVGVFAKRFQDPIERVFLATSGQPVVTFVNAEGATNYGLELEARKSLGFLAESLEPLTAFTNLTLIESRIELGSDPRVAPEERPLIGQAPYVVNVGLTYAAPERDVSATVLYNRIGRRVFEASQPPLPTTYEQPRDVLDLSIRFPIRGAISAKLDARNLLDPAYVLQQGPVVRESYRVGRTFQIGFTWQQ